MAWGLTDGDIDDGCSSQRGEGHADEAGEDTEEQEARTAVPEAVPASAGSTTQTTPKSHARFKNPR